MKALPNELPEYWDARTCEEILERPIGRPPVMCGKPSVMEVLHRDLKIGPYFMCSEHGMHRVEDLGAETIARRL